MISDLLSFRLLKSARQLSNYFGVKLAQSSVSYPQYFILLLLCQPENKEGMYIYELSSYLGLKSCTITRNVAHLGNLVKREKEIKRDGRKTLVSITKAGERLVGMHQKEFFEIDADLSHKNPGLAKKLSELLDFLAKSA